MASNNESDQAPFLPSSSHSIDMIEGNITSSNNRTNSNELSTLDEPVVETIKRKFAIDRSTRTIDPSVPIGDLSAVCRKFGYALFPRQSSSLLQQWDLWGPLILMTVLAILLQSSATKSSSGAQFAEVFTLMLIGSIAVTVRPILRSASKMFSVFRLAQFATARWKNLLFSIGLRSRLLSITVAHCGIREQLSSLRLESIHFENSAHPSFCHRDVRLRLDDVRQRWFLRSNSASESSSFGTLSDLFILFSRCLADHSSRSSEINRRGWRKTNINEVQQIRSDSRNYHGNQSS